MRKTCTPYIKCTRRTKKTHFSQKGSSVTSSASLILLLLAAAESTRRELYRRRTEEAGHCAGGRDAGAGVAPLRSSTVALAAAVPASTFGLALGLGLRLGAAMCSQNAGTCGESNWCSARSGREATHREADARQTASGAADAHLASA